MRRWLSELFKRYRSHHETNRALLEWIGVVGLIAFPGLYLLRFTGKMPPLYDDLAWRAAAGVLCLGLALRRWWPERLQPYYLVYSYATVLYCLAFLLPFTLLQNKGATPSVVNMVISAVLVILLTDWRNTIVMLLTGYALSVVAYWATSSAPQLPLDFLIWWLPLCAVLVSGSSIAKYAEKRAELQRLGRLYAGLAGSIAHEMRTPLMQVRHALDTLGTALASGQPGSAAADDLLRVVRQGQDAVTRGLQGITLTLQQLNPNALDESSFRHLAAADCVRRAVDEFAYQSEQQRRHVRVREQQDFVLRGDEMVLMMVLFNLLKNALYYLPTHPAMAVTVTIDGTGGANRIVVQDTGPGIARERLPALFEEFNSAGKSEGTGLGLAFCRRAMRAFGGDITCESTPGAFTRFTLSFPAVAQAQVEASRDDQLQWARLALAGQQILVVDDELLMRRATVGKLAAMGCEVEEAEDGAQALERLRHAPYDLILLDINMPGMDGFEVARRVRRGDVAGQEAIPILGFTALPASVVADRARQAGMNSFLNKGCDVPELARSIARLMARESSGPLDPLGMTVPALAGRAILLAEDNMFNRAIVKEHLTRLGADVIEAEHGRQVLQLLEAGIRPAAILMDLEMPGLGGIAATRALRALPPPLGAVPIVALTGHGAPQQRQAAREAGMDGLLVKPVDTAALRDELLRVLGASAPARTESPARNVEVPPGLLNTRRIEDFERMGVLGELLPGCLGEIRRHIDRVEQSVAANDTATLHQALHSLVGISGEAGAQALHATAKSFYGTLVQGNWPAEPDWTRKIRQLSVLTEQAVRDRYRIVATPVVQADGRP